MARSETVFGRGFPLLLFLVAALAAVGGTGEAKAGSAPQPKPLTWGGKTFTSSEALRRHVQSHGQDWQTFADRHPGALRQLGVPLIRWAGRSFLSRAALRQFLTARGVSWLSFVRKHPDLVAALPATSPLGFAEMRSPKEAGVLWQADHEEGLKDWSHPGRTSQGSPGGGIFNSGKAVATTSFDRARSGRRSLKATIRTPSTPASGVRAFRWRELRDHRDLFFTAWFFVPRTYRLTADPRIGGFWNVFQFKSRSANGRNDPVWILSLSDEGPLALGWGWGGTQLDGPRKRSGRGGKWFTQERKFPIGRWVRIEARLRQSPDFDGLLRVWQDGILIFDVNGIRTGYRYANARQSWGTNNEWSVNNFSDGLLPNPATIYIDDAAISRKRLFPSPA